MFCGGVGVGVEFCTSVQIAAPLKPQVYHVRNPVASLGQLFLASFASFGQHFFVLFVAHHAKPH